MTNTVSGRDWRITATLTSAHGLPVGFAWGDELSVDCSKCGGEGEVYCSCCKNHNTCKACDGLGQVDAEAPEEVLYTDCLGLITKVLLPDEVTYAYH